MRFSYDLFVNVTDASAMKITLNNIGRAVRGANVTFVATVLNYDGDNLKFAFHDNATPQHMYSVKTHNVNKICLY